VSRQRKDKQRDEPTPDKKTTEAAAREKKRKDDEATVATNTATTLSCLNISIASM
jgi:hypothetical protein